MPIKIASFDLATATGGCDGLYDCSRPRLWTWHLDDAGQGRAQRLAMLRRLLDAYLAQERPDVVGYELPLSIAAIAAMMAKKHFKTSEDTLQMLRGAVGVLESCCAHHGVAEENIIGIRVQQARAHLVGTARPADPKGASMRAATALGWDPQNDNESDAAAIWSLLVVQRNPRMLAALGNTLLMAKDTTLHVKKAAREAGDGPLFKLPKMRI